jgi:TonB-linked SusC/RagA family outer membrane protein
MQNAEQFYERSWVDADINGYNTSYTLTSTEEAMLEDGKSTDWLDLITSPSLQTNHSISVGGGSENTTYNFSTGYLDEGGSLQETEYQRYNIRASLDSKVNKMIKLGFTTNYTYSKLDLGSNEAVRSAYRARPTGVLYYDDVLNTTENNEEDWNGYACWMGIDDSQVLNPVIEADPENFQDETRTSTFSGNAYVELKPFEGLSIKSQISAYMKNSRWGQYRGTYTKSNKTTNDPEAYYKYTMTSSYTLDNIISYTKKFGEHNISFSGIQSAYQYREEYISAEVDALAYESLWYAMGTSDTYDALSTNLTEKTILSYMGRMIYGFKDNRYMLTLTTRWDGASQLSDGNKWDYFPSAAAAWRISDEPFMDGLDAVSSAKLRVSYGFVGNSSVDAYATQATLSQTAYDFDGDDAYGFAPSGLADSELKWEKSEEINIGLDFGLFNNRVTSTIELYNRNTVDLIYDEQLPSSSGYTEVTTNVGEVSNKGIEFLLNTVNVKTSRFSWSTSLNFSKNINEIVSLGDGIEQDISSGLFVGEALDVYYYYEMDGLWQEDEATEAANYSLEPGAVKVVDQNDDGEISSDDDRVIIGCQQPDWIGGITNKFTFDNFDFSFMIYTSQGAMYQNSMLSGTMGEVGRGRYNALNLNMWTYENPGGTWSPYGISNTYRSALYYQDASFIRISDITLGYTVPRSILDRWGIGYARLYAQVTNPFIFTDWDGMDPEYNTSLYGDDVSSMSVMFGMNITF